jgi:hypothetical protein
MAAHKAMKMLYQFLLLSHFFPGGPISPLPERMAHVASDSNLSESENKFLNAMSTEQLDKKRHTRKNTNEKVANEDPVHINFMHTNRKHVCLESIIMLVSTN